MHIARLSALFGLASFSITAAQPSALDFFSFNEMMELSNPVLAPDLNTRLEKLLFQPVIETSDRHPILSREGPLRIAFWNIARGQQWQLIREALTNPSDFRRRSKVPQSDRSWARVAKEIEQLTTADVIVLNEVDWGMKRTGYADVARELASALNMNHVYGIEFLEIDRLYTGQERIRLEDPALTEDLAADLRVDPARYRGWHGNAVLSRLPIRSAKIHRLPSCYDWFADEVKAISSLEQGRRWSAQKVFEERIRRQVRRGGRMALLVELAIPGLPNGALTVVSTHLEDRATPACRKNQAEDLLASLQGIQGAVILAGDLNTTGADGTPTSIRREIMKRVTDEKFWASQAITWFSPVAVPRLFLWPMNYLKNFRDPTAFSIPLLAPNRERALFKLLRSFRFQDNGNFDFSGDRKRSGNRRGKTLANSNERAWKGFRSTFEFERNYFGLVGSYRLDWILVKSLQNSLPSPSRPATLSALNGWASPHLSDHYPITLEIPMQPQSPQQ